MGQRTRPGLRPQARRARRHMSLVIGGVGVAVLFYAARYFAPEAPDLGRLAGLLVLFGGSMLGLVQANHLLVLYLFWS